MRWLSLLLALVAAVLAVVLGRDLVNGLAGPESRPASGKAVLEAFRCRPGETRRVAVRGVEDNYSPLGNEPARGLHPRLAGLDFDKSPPTDFDSATPDTEVADYFELPATTASAIIVMRLKAIVDNANDPILIGDRSTGARGQTPTGHRSFAGLISDLRRRLGWKGSGDVYWAALADLPTTSGGTVLGLVQGAGGTAPLDVVVGDDTAVDFMAVAYCLRPPGETGVTLAHLLLAEAPAPELAGFECRDASADGPRCDPIVGDRSCRGELPLLCFRDLNAPAPTGFKGAAADLMTRRWSGGEVAATAPVRGDRFATIAEADRYCAAQFGKDWRVAEWHLGGSGWGFSARSGGRRFSGRYWIDIRGAPYGTCWRRDHDD
jgi:hypothetical protein